MFSYTDKIIGEGLTYDDVLLVPSYSEIIPKEVTVQSRFSRNINVNIPIVAAAMDTVTEAPMAIAMAQEGGIGVLHKNMSIEHQAEEVLKVKRSENGMITNPTTLHKDAVVEDALKMMREFSIGGIPIVDEQNKLIGIVTNRDLRFEKDIRRPLCEIMTKEVISTNQGTTFAQAAEILQQHRIEKLPVVDNEGHLIGLITYRDIIKVKQRPMACKDNMGRLRVAAGIGITKDMYDRIDAVISAGVDAIVVDTAHGHSKNVVNALKEIKNKYKDVDVVVGNIATPEAATLLADAGADAVKVGIGPGSICTTRVVAGIGMPQLTAVLRVCNALKDRNVPVIADGGIRYSGDIVKALAAGASTIMAGSLLAGTEESPGDTIILEGRKYKAYRGMGSLDAMQNGSKDRYFQSDEKDLKKLVPEGIVGRVPYKGSVTEVIYQLVGGLKAGMGYTGSQNLEMLRQAKFIKITNAGFIEGHPHDITITKEAPNYSR
ncbi:MAG: IMP dehydrogenase [Synergistales bacterium]|nr:IMP dehydrogenase [Bacteroidales bacterium]MDY6435114.1 IMP dehydrogenase [Synergistales bacterium]MDY6382024.1 IMP dehydrogenase [Bacteroidales bacterium]MDY6393599.1 IMP dehydrogenase [Bacteroidales bacterium]MDY6395240.1 IMP dehydrogenase [Bacteroidales bacterium]